VIFTAKNVAFYSGNIFVNFFPNFTILVKVIAELLLPSFLSADVGNQLKVKPGAMVADDVSMEQCATAHCGWKMVAVLSRKISELTGPAT